MSNEPLLIPRKRAARLLGISLTLFDKIVRQKRLVGVRLHKRALYRLDDVRALALPPSKRKALDQEPVSSVVQ